MKRARFSESLMVDILAQAARGDITAGDVCDLHGISKQTYSRWRRKYGDTTTLSSNA